MSPEFISSIKGNSMEFSVEQLRLIRASCITAMPHKQPEEYYEPWKGTYEVATAKLIELGEEV